MKKFDTAVPDTAASSTMMNGCTTLDVVEVDHIHVAAGGGPQTGYGWLRCRPAWLQFFTCARWFLLFTSLSVFLQSMVVNVLVGVTISTVERRFALSSSQTAWIAATYDIAGAPAVQIIGYFGSTLRRPVWIAAGLIMLGVGFGIYSVPHFAAAPYRYSDSGDFSNLCNVWNSSTNHSLLTNNRYDFCNYVLLRVQSNRNEMNCAILLHFSSVRSLCTRIKSVNVKSMKLIQLSPVQFISFALYVP